MLALLHVCELPWLVEMLARSQQLLYMKMKLALNSADYSCGGGDDSDGVGHHDEGLMMIR